LIHRAVGASTSDVELIYVALQKLERDATAIGSLKSAYKKLFKAELLTDLGTRLKGHGLDLVKTLLGEKKGLGIAAGPPGTPAEFESIARAVNAALVDLTAKLAGARLSYALYLLEAPAAASPHSSPVAYVARPRFGVSPTTATVGGGTVSAGTAVPYSFQPKDPTKPVANTQFGGSSRSRRCTCSPRWPGRRRRGPGPAARR
jgi:hypothetical protein